MLYIGITGHRFLIDIKKIKSTLEKALEIIKKAYPNDKKIILSLLADGADRLIVPIAIKYLDAELYAITPTLIEKYLDSLISENSKKEYLKFLSKAKSIINLEIKEDLFKELSDYLIYKSDILIAIWDGKKEQGVGGTGYVVKNAIKNKMPLIIINAGNRLVGTKQSTSLGEKQGKLILKYFKIDKNNHL